MDECEEELHTCGQNELCRNVDGGFECVPYEGMGVYDDHVYPPHDDLGKVTDVDSELSVEQRQTLNEELPINYRTSQPPVLTDEIEHQENLIGEADDTFGTAGPDTRVVYQQSLNENEIPLFRTSKPQQHFEAVNSGRIGTDVVEHQQSLDETEEKMEKYKHGSHLLTDEDKQTAEHENAINKELGLENFAEQEHDLHGFEHGDMNETMDTEDYDEVKCQPGYAWNTLDEQCQGIFFDL